MEAPKPPWKDLVSSALSPAARRVLDNLDDESFLACRDVCVTWRNFIDGYSPKWKKVVKNSKIVEEAIRRGDKDTIELLVKMGRDVNAPDPFDSDLNLAIYWGRVDIVKFLLASGAEVNKTGATPLFVAVFHRRVEIVRILLVHGADIHAYSPFVNLTGNILQWAEMAVDLWEKDENQKVKEILNLLLDHKTMLDEFLRLEKLADLF